MRRFQLIWRIVCEGRLEVNYHHKWNRRGQWSELDEQKFAHMSDIPAVARADMRQS